MSGNFELFARYTDEQIAEAEAQIISKQKDSDFDIRVLRLV
jgi:hypothetical protein